MKNQSGMTLVEIVIATTVLSMVMLSAGTIYIAGAKEYKRITEDASVQIEASVALDHMWQNLAGLVNIPSLADGADNIVANIDRNTTPNQIKYAFNSVDKTIDFYEDFDGAPTSKVAVAKQITSLTFRRPLKKSDGSTIILNYLTIDITAEKGRMKRSFTTGVVLRGMRWDGS